MDFQFQLQGQREQVPKAKDLNTPETKPTMTTNLNNKMFSVKIIMISAETENLDKASVETEEELEATETASELIKAKVNLSLEIKEVTQEVAEIEQVAPILDMVKRRMLKIWIVTMLLMDVDNLPIWKEEVEEELETRREDVQDPEEEVSLMLEVTKKMFLLVQNLPMEVSILILSIL